MITENEANAGPANRVMSERSGRTTSSSPRAGTSGGSGWASTINLKVTIGRVTLTTADRLTYVYQAEWLPLTPETTLETGKGTPKSPSKPL